MKEYKVSNYRYGLPKGTVVAEDKMDNDRLRFLEPIAVKKTVMNTKKQTEETK